MHIAKLHAWPSGVPDANELQESLRHLLKPARFVGTPRTVAGCLVEFDRGNERLFSAVVVVDTRTMTEVESATHVGVATFPFLPGYLSFREIPPLLEAFKKLKTVPEAVVVNRHGYAHPRRLGMASHLGLWLKTPVLGVCPQLLSGEALALSTKAGATAPVLDETTRELVGMAVRTREGSPPVYVSVGMGMTLPDAAAMTLMLCRGRRMPEPLRLAQLETLQLRQTLKQLDPEMAALVKRKR